MLSPGRLVPSGPAWSCLGVWAGPDAQGAAASHPVLVGPFETCSACASTSPLHTAGASLPAGTPRPAAAGSTDREPATVSGTWVLRRRAGAQLPRRPVNDVDRAPLLDGALRPAGTDGALRPRQQVSKPRRRGTSTGRADGRGLMLPNDFVDPGSRADRGVPVPRRRRRPRPVGPGRLGDSTGGAALEGPRNRHAVRTGSSVTSNSAFTDRRCRRDHQLVMGTKEGPFRQVVRSHNSLITSHEDRPEVDRLPRQLR
jgi:hypothetical protein